MYYGPLGLVFAGNTISSTVPRQPEKSAQSNTLLVGGKVRSTTIYTVLDSFYAPFRYTSDKSDLRSRSGKVFGERDFFLE